MKNRISQWGFLCFWDFILWQSDIGWCPIQFSLFCHHSRPCLAIDSNLLWYMFYWKFRTKVKIYMQKNKKNKNMIVCLHFFSSENEKNSKIVLWQKNWPNEEQETQSVVAPLFEKSWCLNKLGLCKKFWLSKHKFYLL